MLFRHISSLKELLYLKVIDKKIKKKKKIKLNYM